MANSITGETIQTTYSGLETAMYTKLSLIENELHDAKTLLRTPKKIVSLKGLLKGIHITDDEIETAKKSLFKHI